MKKINKNKKAIGMGFIVALILALLLFVVLLFAIKYINAKSDYDVRKERCKDSVKLQAFTASRSINIAERLDCPTETIVLQSSNENALKRAMANQMYDCWDKMGRRELQLWDDRKEKFCMICSTVTFTDKTKQLKDFHIYLMEHRPANEQKNYFELMFGQQITPEEYKEQRDPKTVSKGVTISSNVKAEEMTIDTSKQYAVVFNFITEEYINRMESGAIGVGLGVGGTALVITYFVPGLNVITITGTAIVGAVSFVGFFVGYSVAGNPDWQSYVSVIEYTPESMKMLGCDEIPASVAVRGQNTVTNID